MKLSRLIQILTLFCSLPLWSQINTVKWEYIGPKETTEQVKGLFKSVWIDNENMNFILAGSSSGGLFMTENALSPKPVWKNIFDSYGGMCYGISDIVVRPNSGNKIIYVATGHRSGLPVGYGNGILKTFNGGESWLEVGPKATTENLFCMEGLVVNKENPKEMIAYTSNEVFITRDEWDTFEKIELPVDKNNRDVSLCDADFAPHEPGKFYVCTRTNNHYNSKLFVCENYGNIISDITPKIEKSERIEVCTLEDEKRKGKFYIALGYSNAYVAYYDGKEFHKLNKQPVNHAFSGTYWNLELCVNQSDTNIIYLAMTETSRSTDGGKTFSKIATYNGHNTHADVRAMILMRSTPKGEKDALFLANDGGISFTEKYNPPSWRSLNGSGLDANQFWGIDVAQSDSLLIAGGVQDNGGFVISSYETLNTIYNCGDGYLSAVIDEHSAILQCNPPALFYHNLKTKRNDYIYIPDPDADPRRPMQVLDSFVYIGHHQIWRANKNKISKGLMAFEKFSDIPDVKFGEGGIKNHVIRTFHIGESSALVAYTNPLWQTNGLNGKLFFCRNIKEQDKVWEDITSAAVFNGLELCRWSEISTVMIDPENHEKFYIVSRDQFNQTGCLLFTMEYISDSARFILKKINHNLPKIGINRIKADPFSNIVYLATDDGVYYSPLSDEISEWKKLNATQNKLPNVMVTDIALNFVNNTLIAGTYGRGAWRTRLLSSQSVNRSFNQNTVINSVVKIDGKLEVRRKKKVTVNSKLIISSGSVIELKKGSVLEIKNASLIRDENNELADISKLVKKARGAKLIVN